MSPSKEQIQAIRERAEKATPGPWIHHSVAPRWDTPNSIGYDERGGRYHATGPSHDEHDWQASVAKANADGLFIAHAREDVPALLAYVGDLEQLGREAVCTFCGGVFPKDATGLIREHIATCEARKDAYDTTLRAAEAERDALQRRVERLEEALREISTKDMRPAGMRSLASRARSSSASSPSPTRPRRSRSG